VAGLFREGSNEIRIEVISSEDWDERPFSLYARFQVYGEGGEGVDQPIGTTIPTVTLPTIPEDALPDPEPEDGEVPTAILIGILAAVAAVVAAAAMRRRSRAGAGPGGGGEPPPPPPAE
jgi:hypothetical protein